MDEKDSHDYDLDNPCKLSDDDCKEVISILKDIKDPEIPINIYDMGLIYEIRYSSDDKKSIEVIMTFTSPFCPVIGQIVKEITDRLENIFQKVEVEVVWEPTWNRSMMKDEAGFI